MQELESELSLTTRTLGENVWSNHVVSKAIISDPFNVYLARMIDERLEAKTREDRKGIAGGTGV